MKSEEPEEVMAGKFIKTIKAISHKEIKGNVQLQSDVDANQNREEHLQLFFFFNLLIEKLFAIPALCVSLRNRDGKNISDAFHVIE